MEAMSNFFLTILSCLFVAFHHMYVTFSLMSFAPLSQVFSQRQQSSFPAAPQPLGRQEFPSSSEKGNLGITEMRVCDWWHRNLLYCVLALPCFSNGRGPAEIGLLLLLWLTQSLSLPSCHTQDFSEYRNSRIGIQADWFSLLTVSHGRRDTRKMIMVRWQKDRESQRWTHLGI